MDWLAILYYKGGGGFGATNPVAEARDARSSAPKPSAVESWDFD